MNIQPRRAWIAAEFARRYGDMPTLWVRAPGRVDLMGSHTDYNEGFVLTLSIDRDTWIAARPRRDDRVRFQSLNVAGDGEFALDDIRRDRELRWTNYVRGVAHILQGEGYALRGWDGVIHSTVPISSGLSSSAALEVAAALVFQQLGAWEIEPLPLALLCQRAENQFVGMNCGILDQYSSTFGRAGCAILLDCRQLSSEPVPLHPSLGIVICDTRTKRELTGSEYPMRRAQCEQGARLLKRFHPNVNTLRDVSVEQLALHKHELDAPTMRRCRFIVEENQRVLSLAHVLPTGERDAIGTLTAESFAGARDLYEIVSPEMERMMAAMLAARGIIGARQAGAGFGGCMVAFVERDRINDFARDVEQDYKLTTGSEPHVFAVEAAAGAGQLVSS
jgi:galactokinase